MHPELAIAEKLHAGTHVVLHEDTTVAAALVPIASQPVTILECAVHIVPMVHHQAVTGAMQAIEQPELLLRTAQPIARSQQHRLSERHSNARVEIALQDAVIAAGLIP